MRQVLIRLPGDIYREVQSHLFPKDSDTEQVGFIFARRSYAAEAEVFEFLEWQSVGTDGFLVQSQCHFELADDTRSSIIKRAHDLDASIVEFHTHALLGDACFSPSDLRGLEEFVPHVWWRLRGKPYLAVVMTRRSFDGLAWLVDPKTPEHLDGIEVEGHIIHPTRLSPLRYDADEY